MAETRDVGAVMEAAERAAGAGDFVTAASLLRQAASTQEAALGPTHPDLANTLNNLGVVCERIEQPAEAERCYRRAYAIASTAFQSDHPFVVMSAKNLRDFCETRGVPFDVAPVAPTPAAPEVASVPPAARAVPVAPAPAAPNPVTAPKPSQPAPPASATATPAKPVALQAPARPAKTKPNLKAHPARPAVTAAAAMPPATRSTWQLVLAALVVLALIAVAVFLLRTGGSSRADLPDAQATTPSARGAATPAALVPAAEHGATPSEAPPSRPAPQTSDPKTSAPAAPATTSPSSTSFAQSGTRPAPPPASTPTSTVDDAEAGGTRVVEGHVCSSLQTGSRWRCTPPNGPVSSGVVYFYTRLSVPSPTKVEHRWFQGSRLHQTIPLRVPAVSSYRTYSQMRVTPARAGEWRVEVRGSNGAVLQEERFTIAP